MKKIAILHTVPSVYASFPGQVREALGEVKIVNTLDEFLASDANEKGEFTKNNLNRLYAILRCAEMTDPDAIVVSCSTLTPGVETLRPCIGVPLICIDGAMIRKTLETGSRILILASAPSAARAARASLEIAARRMDKTADIAAIAVEPAFDAIRRLDTETHDRLMLEAAGKIANRDVVMLAQASTAHLEDAVAKATGIPTLSSPRLCLEEIRQALA